MLDNTLSQIETRMKTTRPSKHRLTTAPLFVASLFALAASGTASASCGAASCSLNTDWDIQGTSGTHGARLGLRYEYIKQDQLRAGSDKTVAQGVSDTHDELSTVNRNLIASIDYSAGQWGVTAQLPLLDRTHAHIHNDPVNGAETEQWDFSSVGDLRVVGRYQLPAQPFQSNATGFKFGAKLPTGQTDKANSEGVLAERPLQPGSGSTDLILGAYHNWRSVGSSFAWFAHILFQTPVSSHDHFRPGDQTAIDVGASYPVSPELTAMVQINGQIKSRDSGSNAEPESSGGKFVNLSPGAAYAVGKNVQIYGFVQMPLYQYVNGTQLTPDWSAVLGANYQF